MTSKRMTRAEMIRWLGDAISTETEKPFEEIDYDFVEECGQLLDELMGKSAAMSEEEIANRIEKLNPDTTYAVRKKIRGKKLWKIAVAAAVVLCMSMTVMAVPAWRQVVLTAIGLDVGKAVNENGITYTHTGEIKVYSDMDELIEAEKLDILSYRDTDNNLLITNIDYISDISRTIITFNDPTINFQIQHNVSIINDNDTYEKITTSYFEAYIVEKFDRGATKYNSYFIYNNDTYSIYCSDKSQLLLILNSLYSGDKS